MELKENQWQPCFTQNIFNLSCTMQPIPEALVPWHMTSLFGTLFDMFENEVKVNLFKMAAHSRYIRVHDGNACKTTLGMYKRSPTLST